MVSDVQTWTWNKLGEVHDICVLKLMRLSGRLTLSMMPKVLRAEATALAK